MSMELARGMAAIGVFAAFVAPFVVWFIAASGARLRLKLVVRVFAGTMAAFMVMLPVVGALEKMSEVDTLLLMGGVVIAAVLWLGRHI